MNTTSWGWIATKFRPQKHILHVFKKRTKRAATTTDILGPFYRPGAPVGIILNLADFSGDVLTLSGTLFMEDGKTPVNTPQ